MWKVSERHREGVNEREQKEKQGEGEREGGREEGMKQRGTHVLCRPLKGTGELCGQNKRALHACLVRCDRTREKQG